MKATNYRQVLKARGYKCFETSKYQGTQMFVKEHLLNKVVCYVEKDSHGKGQKMVFGIYPKNTQHPLLKDMEEFKKTEFDREYLKLEALKIYEAFEQLKNLKGKKYIYCF